MALRLREKKQDNFRAYVDEHDRVRLRIADEQEEIRPRIQPTPPDVRFILRALVIGVLALAGWCLGWKLGLWRYWL